MIGPGLAVEGLSLRFGGFALCDVDLSLGAGEVLALLGPNGAGKSVTLEAIAGFHRPHSGCVIVAGEDVTALPPERRRLGLMPQNFALFPHMTVADNVALPIRIAGTGGQGRASARRQAAALLQRFGILSLADRFPQLLSPGERQRAALARALAARPLAFLFDEPFSALDAVSRQSQRAELGEFLREAEIPAIFVTHDPEEAALIAGRIAIMRDGRVVQQGSAGEVYRRPADVETARFLGVENILAAQADRGEGGCRAVVVGKARLIARTLPPRGGGGKLFVCIRAEEVALRPAASVSGMGMNRLAATVRTIGGAGPLVTVSLDCGVPLVARLLAREVRALGLVPGAAIIAEIADDAIHVIE